MSRELLPCPFCGGQDVDAEGWASETTSGPACNDCGGSCGSASATREENIKAWNTRAPVSVTNDPRVVELVRCASLGVELPSALSGPALHFSPFNALQLRAALANLEKKDG